MIGWRTPLPPPPPVYLPETVLGMTHGHLALSVEPLTFTFFDDLVIAVARDLALA